MQARTHLFVPGNRPERFAKALGSGAGAVVLDREDAAAPAAKDKARAAIERWTGEMATSDERSRVVVRIDEAGSAGA